MNEVIRLVAQFLVTGLSVLIVATLLPGMRVKRYGDAVGFAIVVAVLNVIVSYLLGLGHPHLSVELWRGLGGMVLNALIFLVAKRFVSGVEISGCFVAAIAAFLVSVINSALFHALRDLLR